MSLQPYPFTLTEMTKKCSVSLLNGLTFNKYMRIKNVFYFDKKHVKSVKKFEMY